MLKSLAIAVTLIVHSVRDVQALDNGVGRLPAWNAYQCNIDEELMLTTAKLMKELGLLDVGYNYVNIDDCYSEKNRSADGFIVEGQPSDTIRNVFSIGGRSHTLQKWNEEPDRSNSRTWIYSDSGWFTCAGYPGSFQNEDRDIKTFSDWGFDYLKYDNCTIPYDSIIREGIVGKYQRMADAIANLAKETGNPPILFSLCEWGWSQVWIWGKQFGQSWRVCVPSTFDLGVTKSNSNPTRPQEILLRVGNHSRRLSTSTRSSPRPLTFMDIMIWICGNGGLTFDESKSHFTAWALMKSPLLMSAITPEILGILKNTEILAINQDAVVGESISPFRWGVNPDWTYNETYPAQYWSGRSENGSVFMLLNTLNETASMFFNLTESPWIRAGRQYSVRDLWAHTDNGTAVRNFTAENVPPHGVVALLLKDAGDEPDGLFPECSVWWQCTDQNGTRVGG
ncbi:glycoside hydrolase family 27 protein [Moniliophthora roreri]|nr:glycoside hydrolase family 27 protein [Moniliophthora roreri]